MNIKGLSKAAVLAALYNASRPQGMGFLHYDPTPMTEAEAEKLIGGDNYFDYLKGRVMKVSLASDNVNTQLYNRDNGPLAAETAVSALLSSADVNAIEIVAAHQVGKELAADKAEKLMGTESELKTNEGIAEMYLGLSDVKDHLAPAVEKARKPGGSK